MREILLFAVIILCSFQTMAQPGSKGMGLLEEDKNSSGVVRAVIIGVSDYKTVQSLQYAHSDALSFYYFLRSPAGGEIDSSNILLLLNEKATAAQIFGALDWLLAVTQEGDQVIFYFSGHGDLETKTIRQNGFLLAHDSPEAAYMSGGTIGINYLQ